MHKVSLYVLSKRRKRYIELHGQGNIRDCGIFVAVTWVPSEKYVRLKRKGLPRESLLPHRVCFHDMVSSLGTQ